MNMVRPPTLAEILTNQATHPYTLSAFMAFLSHNHCLETLEFTLDASRYQTRFYSLPQVPPIPGSPEAENLRVSWDRLINSYIRPGALREVNLPSFDRDFLLRIPNTYTPPSPEALDGAVYKINELMRDSVLTPFLESCQQSSISGSQNRQMMRQPNLVYTNQMRHSHHADSRAYQPQEAANVFGQTSHYGGDSGKVSMQFGFPQVESSNNSYDFNTPQQFSSTQQFPTQARRTSRPGSARPTSMPSIDYQLNADPWSNQGDADSEMSGSEDPITPPHTPPAGSSPTAGGQWRSKIKNQFSRMNGNRAKSREHN